MKIVFFVLMIISGLPVVAQQVTVMSFNIRFNNPGDSLNAWLYRKEKVASQILFHEVDLLGVQEALTDQMIDLKERLKGYAYIGGGRDDGKTKGEYSAIFYHTKKLKLQDKGQFWLSTTPEVPGSKSWDAAITRTVTWGKFIEIKSGKVFYMFNTHFDHVGKVARKESAILLLRKIKEIAAGLPIILSGDFNARPQDEPIQVITEKQNPLRLYDTKDMSSMPHYGPEGTFNAFTNKETSNQPIDYIFIKGSWKVLRHATLSQTWEGRFASDHFAVMAVLSL